MPTTLANWYDYPQYFDLVFRDENALEVAFFEAAFAKYLPHRPQRILELGCGGGRMVVELAARGYEPVGLDVSPACLRYLKTRLRRRGLQAELIEGDMTQFDLAAPVDAALCTFDTFRHLLSEAAALQHLESVARAVVPGGIYILGFHIIPLDADPDCTERWKAKHGATEVGVTLTVRDFRRDLRRESMRATLTAKRRATGGKPEAVIRCRSEFDLRLYTVEQAAAMLEAAESWQVAEVFDFDYDIDAPRAMDDDLTDALFVLRRR